jgi:16S rRNA (cytosine1402-N4)-methyltransferase
MTEAAYHIPVLLNESVDALNIRPDGTYVDVTFGGGGHSREILKRLGAEGRLVAFDQDPDAEANVPADERFTFVAANFRFLKNYLRLHGITEVSGILADLGVSSHQFDEPGRGFTLRADTPLDMRMNPGAGRTAADILNNDEETKLADIFFHYGEFRNARALARAIVAKRAEKRIRTSADLEMALGRFVPPQDRHKFLARVFQALRIEVNGEMDVLREFLPAASDVMEKGGRLAVISYHSLEDRPVKYFMRTGNMEGKEEKDFFGNPIRPMKPLSAKAIVPSEEEILRNNRARSAKLRIAEKL